MVKPGALYIKKIDHPTINSLIRQEFRNKIKSIETKEDSDGGFYYLISFLGSNDRQSFITRLKQKSGNESKIDFNASVDESDGKDDFYFESYCSTYIHRLMLGDVNRNKAYYKAILQNAHLFKDKVVMDIGAGSGILSLYAARAGASKVFAVEAVGSMASVCKEIVEKNGFEDVVEVLVTRIEDIEWIGKEVDIIVSEWMGYALFYEGMLKSVLHARDKFLKKEGLMFPNEASVKLVGYSDPSIFKRESEILSTQPFDLSCLEEEILSAALIQNCFCLSTKTCNVLSFDLENWNFPNTGTYLDSNWTLYPKGEANETVVLHGFLIYFNVSFTHGERPVVLSTRPSDGNLSNHWKHTLLMLKEPLSFANSLHGYLKIKEMNSRQLEFNLRIKNGRQQRYFL